MHAGLQESYLFQFFGVNFSKSKLFFHLVFTILYWKNGKHITEHKKHIHCIVYPLCWINFYILNPDIDKKQV